MLHPKYALDFARLSRFVCLVDGKPIRVLDLTLGVVYACVELHQVTGTTPEFEQFRYDTVFQCCLVSCASLYLCNTRSLPIELTRLLVVVADRLLMFHVYFLKHIARPEGLTLQQIAEQYDSRNGFASREQKEDLQRYCKQLLRLSHWKYGGLTLALHLAARRCHY